MNNINTRVVTAELRHWSAKHLDIKITPSGQVRTALTRNENRLIRAGRDRGEK
jgi:hypothetical protein